MKTFVQSQEESKMTTRAKLRSSTRLKKLEEEEEEELVKWCQEPKVEEEIKEEANEDDFHAPKSKLEAQPESDQDYDADQDASDDTDYEEDDNSVTIKPEESKKVQQNRRKYLVEESTEDQIDVVVIDDDDDQHKGNSNDNEIENHCQSTASKKDVGGQDTSSDAEVILPKFQRKRKVRRCRKDHVEAKEADSDLEDDSKAAKRKAFKELKESRKRRMSRTSTDQNVEHDQEEEKEENGGNQDANDSEGSDVISSPNKRSRQLHDSSDDNDNTAEDKSNEDNGEEVTPAPDGDADAAGEEETAKDNCSIDEQEIDESDLSDFVESDDEESDLGSSSNDEDLSERQREKNNFRSEMQDILANLSRSTEKHRLLTDDYHDKVCEEKRVRADSAKKRRQAKNKRRKNTRAKKQLTYSNSDDSDNEIREGKNTDISKVKIYKPLINGLRPLASRKDLSDVEIINEFVFYSLQIDHSCSGQCICTKEGLKYNFFIWNKNIKDVVKRSLEHKVCVGSECIKHFTVAGSPMAFFHYILRRGVLAYYRHCSNDGKLVFSLASSGKEYKYLETDWSIVNRDYTLPIEKQTIDTDEGDKLVFNASVFPGKKLRHSMSDLKKDHRYRIHLNTYAEKHPVFGKKTPLGFRLVKLLDEEEKAAVVRENRISDPRSFIKNV